MLQETIDLKFLDNLGITRLGLKYCPSIDINDETGEPYVCGTHSDYFIVRYNKKNISLQKRYDDYANNRDVQGCLKDLDLDPDMFWYVLLFVYDYCKDKLNSDLWGRTEGNVKQHIEDFSKSILNNIDYKKKSFCDKEENDEEVELTLKIGKKKLKLTDVNVIRTIGLYCLNGLEESNLDILSVCVDTNKTISIANIAYLFCDILKYHFDNNQQVVEKRAKGANISNKEKELLSYLVYFVGFNSNKKLLEPLADNYNTIKWVMNEKNKARIKVTGDIYM